MPVQYCRDIGSAAAHREQANLAYKVNDNLSLGMSADSYSFAGFLEKGRSSGKWARARLPRLTLFIGAGFLAGGRGDFWECCLAERLSRHRLPIQIICSPCRVRRGSAGCSIVPG